MPCHLAAVAPEEAYMAERRRTGMSALPVAERKRLAGAPDSGFTIRGSGSVIAQPRKNHNLPLMQKPGAHQFNSGINAAITHPF
jgi:hypothetical protein